MRASSVASRLFYPVVLLLIRIVLIRLVGRLVPHLVPSSRLVLLIASPLVSRSIPVPLGYRLIVLSCRGHLACSSRFSFHLSYRLDGM